MEALDNYLEKYSNINNTRICLIGESNKDIKEGKVNEACRFDLKPFNDKGCTKANDYGFKDGKPCVILSLNRLIGWEPKNFEEDSVPQEVLKRYKSGSIAFNCNGMVN